jgi:hypothetical protein
MIRIIDPDQLGIPVIDLGGLTVPNETPSHACHRCDAYRPAPLPDGNLVVDPEIHLPSIGMDVDIAYFYNAKLRNSEPGEHSIADWSVSRLVRPTRQNGNSPTDVGAPLIQAIGRLQCRP